MTIKAKLITNVLLTAAIIVAISLSSFFTMRFLQEKLSYLTQKSTPYQMRTIEFQRELQVCIANMFKVNAARNITELASYRAEAEKTLDIIDETQKALEKMGAVTPGVSNELIDIALDLFDASEERIKSHTAVTAAEATVVRRMQESSVRLNDLDSNVRGLQENYSKAFAIALENTEALSRRTGSIEELRNLVRELQLLAVTLPTARNASAVLIATGKHKTIEGRIANNEYFKTNTLIAGSTLEFSKKLAEHIKLRSIAISQKNDDSINAEKESGKDLLYKLNDLFQTLDQQTIQAREELSFAHSQQRDIYNQSKSANSILVANSELVALGMKVTSDTNRLFALGSPAELGALDLEIRAHFTKMNERVQLLESLLAKFNARKELRILHDAVASLATIRNEIYSAGGIVSTLKKKLNAIERANTSADKLQDIVIRQTSMGKKSISTAQLEQEKSIVAVNNMVTQSLARIIGVGAVAIVIGILFGFWIYRSVLRPLRVIRDAVNRQQQQGKEQANLAEAVAGGELSREVTVSEVIRLDPSQIQNDEMGVVLNAIVGMSEAQVMLDRSLAGMTAALRSSRDEDARRDRLKSGLNEFNKILRDEQKISDLADRALAFIADYLGAGVGIVYLHNEKNGMLQTLSTYAIARSKRLDDGFLLGEGLPGQVAQEQKMRCFNSIPPDYLPITSALGASDPLNIVVMPIMHNDTLVGVLELGCFRQFGEDDFDFLKQSLEGTAIAININRSHQLVHELLEQTQQQAEELRVQQEELQQTNEELQERAWMLAEKRSNIVESP